MEVAAATGGEALEDFAKVSGMSASQFKDLWERDAASAFQAFIVGLSKMDEQGVSAIKTLDDIGIAEIRLRDTLLRATNATELFSKTQVTANAAWEKNNALTIEATKRYATTKSRLTNLNNTALMFARQIGDDLNPTIQQIIDKANDLLQRFLSLDVTQRQSIVKWAAFAAAVGPVVLVLGKVVGAVGTVTSAMGKAFIAIGNFSAKVTLAGGGLGGFIKALASSKVAMAALAAALVYGAVKLVDYASGTKAAREALEGMAKTARSWKETAADTFYGNSQGLSFFGMSKEDFTREGRDAVTEAKTWLDSVVAVWTDGKKENDEVVSQWTDSFRNLNAGIREQLKRLKEQSDEKGTSFISAQLQADIDTLNNLDAEIAALLKKRQNKVLTDEDKVRLKDLIDARDAIEVKYRLSEEQGGGFDTIRKKLEVEAARAGARGEEIAVDVYENALVAAAQGLSAINRSLDDEYEKQYNIIKQLKSSTEQQQAMDALNQRYLNDRRKAALEYAEVISEVAMPVWEKGGIQEAKEQVGNLMMLLRQYSSMTDENKKAFLPELEKMTAGMDEGAIAEYVGLLTQIQSLIDSGMTEKEVQDLFPDIDFSSALEQLAAIQTYLNDNKWDSNLKSLNDMFGDAVGEEILRITTDLDMTGAKSRWEEWASNPGAITTNAVIGEYSDAGATYPKPTFEAFISKYTENPNGADTSGLSPEVAKALVKAYEEVANGADISNLTPDQISAKVWEYLESNNPSITKNLSPDKITAYISEYLEDPSGVKKPALSIQVGISGYDLLSYNQWKKKNKVSVDGIVRLSEIFEEPSDVLGESNVRYWKDGVEIPATVVTQTMLKPSDIAILDEDGTMHVLITPEITGSQEAIEDMREEVAEVDQLGTTALGQAAGILPATIMDFIRSARGRIENYKNPGFLDFAWLTDLLNSTGRMQVLDQSMQTDFNPERAAELSTYVAEVVKAIQNGETVDKTDVENLMQVLQFIQDLDSVGVGGNVIASLVDSLSAAGVETDAENLAASLEKVIGSASIVDGKLLEEYERKNDELQAVRNEMEQLEQDVDQRKKELQERYKQLQDLYAQYGKNVSYTSDRNGNRSVKTWSDELKQEGLLDKGAEQALRDAEAAFMEAQSNYTNAKDFYDAIETVYEETAQRVEELGEALTNITPVVNEGAQNVGASMAVNIGKGMNEYDYSSDAEKTAGQLKTAMGAEMTASTLKPVGLNSMSGLKAGILEGRSSVVSAMRQAARDAVNAAKQELRIASPSRVFRDEIGTMAMKGFSEGILGESRVQARTIQNAFRYLTGQAAVATAMPVSHRSYTQNYDDSVNLNVKEMIMRGDIDAMALAQQISSLGKRGRRARGSR